MAGDTTPFEEIVAVARHPVLVVTAAAPGGEPAGCLVGFHTQCSIEPVRYLVCLALVNRTYEVARNAAVLAVHRIGADRVDLARLFGEVSGHDADKFGRCNWSRGPGGVPVLDDVESWWAGRILELLPLGDHCGFLVEPFAGVADSGDLARPAVDAATASAFEPGNPLG